MIGLAAIIWLDEQEIDLDEQHTTDAELMARSEGLNSASGAPAERQAGRLLRALSWPDLIAWLHRPVVEPFSTLR
ncbi:MAG: hypothetical protein HY020_24505 [Burkholderiales bacterium]|nr:hypothetical protein [Burkholderiales bacterium]